MNKNNRLFLSSFILLLFLGLTYFRLPGVGRRIVVLSGTELEEALRELERKFEQENPNIDVELKFQGSQDIVNNYIDQKNDFDPTVLIPANGEVLVSLEERWNAQNQTPAFYGTPQPIAKTVLVAIAWEERGEALFKTQTFQWQTLETAISQQSWDNIAGEGDWGSFDFAMSDPIRSNSSQLALLLWAQAKLGETNLEGRQLSQSEINELFSLIKGSVYQPPRSTDILLQEFISRGPNEMDVATVYESIALYRWPQATANQQRVYQIYYPNPTVETTSTGAIARQNINKSQAKTAQKWLDFLLEPEQQTVFVQHGFRPVDGDLDPTSVPDSPWSEAIPGSQPQLSVEVLPTPSAELVNEVQRQWSRAN